MNRCAHVIIKDEIQRYINTTKTLLGDLVEQELQIKCEVCSAEKDLYVIFNCGTIVCGNHLHNKCDDHYTHTAYYNINADSVYCAMCGECLMLDQNQAQSSVASDDSKFELSNYILLKTLDNNNTVSYINAIFQMLLNLIYIRDYFFRFHHDILQCRDPMCPDCLFKKLYSQIFSFNPVSLDESLNYIARKSKTQPSFAPNNMREIYLMLVNCYHMPGRLQGPCHCVMHSIFYGVVMASAKCSACQYVTVYNECFNIIEMESLHCLAQCTSHSLSERVMAAPRSCKQCSSPCLTSKMVKITAYPKILCISIIHACDGKTHGSRKNRSPIKCELKIENINYNIYAIVERKKGIRNCFICYILLENEWYEFKNSRITKGVVLNVKNINAAMLFYEQADMI